MWNYVQEAGRRVKAFVSRHRVAFIAGAVVVGAGVYAYNHYRNRYLQWETKLLTELRMSEYFSTTQYTCTESVLAELPNLKTQIMNFADVPTTEKLRAASSLPQEEKLALWDKYKNVTFTRLYLSVYSLCLFGVYQRLQLTLISKYMYLDSMHQRNDHQLFGSFFVNNKPETDLSTKPLSDDEKRLYLLSKNYFLQTGLEVLCKKIHRVTTQELKEWPLQKKCRKEDINKLLANLRTALEEEISELGLYLMPLKSSSTADPSSTNRVQLLLAETRSCLFSEKFNLVVRDLLAQLFLRLETHAVALLDDVAAGGPVSAPPTPGPGVTPADLNAPTLPIAKIIPLLNKHFDNVVLPDDPMTTSSEYLRALFGAPALDEFSRRVFGLFEPTTTSGLDLSKL